MLLLDCTSFFLDLLRSCSSVLTSGPVVAVPAAPKHQIHFPLPAFSDSVVDFPLLLLFDSGIFFHHFESGLLKQGCQVWTGNALEDNPTQGKHYWVAFSKWALFFRAYMVHSRAKKKRLSPAGNCQLIWHCGWWNWSLSYTTDMSWLSQTIAVYRSSKKHLTAIKKKLAPNLFKFHMQDLSDITFALTICYAEKGLGI